MLEGKNGSNSGSKIKREKKLVELAGFFSREVNWNRRWKNKDL